MPEIPVSVDVNGRTYRAFVEPRKTLADFIREDCTLTGTHLGCEHGVCGACTVLVDGEAVRSCLMFAVQAQGSEVTTIEGLTPGMIVTAHALLSEEPDADADRVREVLSGNICRCTGYISIVEAVLDARAAYKPKDGAVRAGENG